MEMLGLIAMLLITIVALRALDVKAGKNTSQKDNTIDKKTNKIFDRLRR